MAFSEAPLLTPAEVTNSAVERLLPPTRTMPSEAAKQLSNDKGVWDPTAAPMMVEPLNVLAGREYQGIAFVGPQRSSKTFGLILGSLTYIITCAPGDTLVVQMSKEAARDFSRGDFDKAIRYSPALSQRLSQRPRDDNTFDKWFRSGMFVKLGWPSVTQLSGKTFRYVFITDYDRPENRDNVDGEGPLWDLTFKRIQTYMSRGKCLAESSVGSDYLDAKWNPKTPHEAPPARGILSIYNNGTRGRWYWPCMGCNAPFEATPGFRIFGLPEFDELKKLVVSEDIQTLADEYSRITCRSCGRVHEPKEKRAMNEAGLWVHEGQKIVKGVVKGKRIRTKIWSGWLGGAAASYQTWNGILTNYFQSVLTYVRTGDESPMRLATTSDAGGAYLPEHIRNRRTPEQLIDRLEDWKYGTVPDGVKYLTGGADVQAHRFVCEVWGWGVGQERWLIDRFEITSSKRPEGNRTAALDPAAYMEDWKVLVEALVCKRYENFGVMVALCDSGGKAGVTEKALEFWRFMRDEMLGQRFRLLKGTGRKNAKRFIETWPDSQDRKDRFAGSKGDVPVYLINTNTFKDGVVGDLARMEPGPGFVHLPRWIIDKCPNYFNELTAEIRTQKGWENPDNSPNEAFDLLSYNKAACVALNAEQIDWSNPPPWVTTGPIKPITEPKEQSKKPSYLDRHRGYLSK